MKSEMANEIAQLSTAGRQAVSGRNWPLVMQCAKQILIHDGLSAEGWFLKGLAEQTFGNTHKAMAAFKQAIKGNPERYDAAVELAKLHWAAYEHAESKNLLEQYKSKLSNSPLYLYMAAETYTKLGLHSDAWPLYKQANTLQPNIDRFQASMAANATLLGEIGEAKLLYLKLLEKHPAHQRHHFELSKLATATDNLHIQEMLKILADNRSPAEKNIFLYYAIAKEFEDLRDWRQAFDYYQQGGNAAAKVSKAAGYKVADDIELMDTIVEVNNASWLKTNAPSLGGAELNLTEQPTPIFVVGLPRTGTTLAERIIASHSKVESADESFFLQIALKQASQVSSNQPINADIIRFAESKNVSSIASEYLRAVDYRLSGEQFFVEKYPFNFMYIGFIAKAFPNSPIVYLKRNPMDACFALFKQSFFNFAYTLEDIGNYYLAYDRLYQHWMELLGDRIIVLEYETLVTEPEFQIKRLLKNIGLEYETDCLNFHQNKTASATASTVQVREKPHTRSVDKWKNWKSELAPLYQKLSDAGIV